MGRHKTGTEIRNMQLRWIASQSASCFHAAAAMFGGETLTDPQVAAALADPLDTLRGEIVASQLPAALFWEHLVPLAAGIENNRELADVLQRKILPAGQRSEFLTSRLAAGFSALEAAYRETLPDLVDELAARAQPLRQQWEARGPGLLKTVARLSDERLIVEQADVILVRPVLGGMAVAHLPYNSVRMEAVLADPHATLPETVRLAWVLAQLNLDLPLFSERLRRDRLGMVAQLAMLPVVLQAAEHVELAAYDQRAIQLALEVWHIEITDDVPDEADQLADTISRWYAQYTADRPDWAVALAALDRMLKASGR